MRIPANIFVTSLVGGNWLADFNAAPSLIKARKYNKALTMLGGREVNVHLEQMSKLKYSIYLLHNYTKCMIVVMQVLLLICHNQSVFNITKRTL